jgi:hypothetical protein
MALSLIREKTSPPQFPNRYGEAVESLPSARQSGEAKVCAASSVAYVGGLAGGGRMRSGKIKHLKSIKLNSRLICLMLSASAEKVCCGGKKCFSVS